MKRIIAAALSILLGAFGYTIVDSAIENRVATLESEVVELREEVSKYHPQYTTNSSTIRATHPNTSVQGSISTTERKNIYAGRYFDKDDASKSKFLLRFYSNGYIKYISPDDYGTTTTKSTSLSVPFSTARAVTTYPLMLADNGELTTSNNLTTQPQVMATTTQNQTTKTTTQLSYEDYFLYLTNSSVQVTAVDEKEEYSYGYNNDYSLVSQPLEATTATIVVTYEGYTDPIFAGYEIKFDTTFASLLTGWVYELKQTSGNAVCADGSFEYTETYTISAPYSWSNPIKEYRGFLRYSVDSVKLT